MMLDQVKDTLNKIPYTLFLFFYLGYLWMQYHTFTTDDTSPLIQKQRQIESIKQENAKLGTKINEANAFFRSLEAKRSEIRGLASDLEQMKVTLTEELDIPAFIKLAITEAKRSGLQVLSLKPTESSRKEYYMEQAFDLVFRGVYFQLLVFLERLSSVQRVVRVDNFEIKPVGPQSARYVELEGKIQIKTYRYLGSSADDIAKAGGSTGSGGASAAPASSAGGKQ